MKTHPRNYGGRGRFYRAMPPTPNLMPNPIAVGTRLCGETLSTNLIEPNFVPGPPNPLARRVADLEARVLILLQYVKEVDDDLLAHLGESK